MNKYILKKLTGTNYYKILELKKYFYFSKLPEKKVLSLGRNECYLYFNNYFKFKSKRIIRKHRNYFSKSKRGYGEDPFHAMWEFLINIFKPKLVLEIGVYRGQVISLLELLISRYTKDYEVWGISPLDNSRDSVSSYKKLNYIEDIKKNFIKFNLRQPNLIKAYSHDSKAINFISSKNWDLIYIDGSHEYENVKKDIDNCLPFIKSGGLIVLDDSSLYEDFNLHEEKLKYFKGHPGPSKVMQELKKSNDVRFYLGVGHNNVFIKN